MKKGTELGFKNESVELYYLFFILMTTVHFYTSAQFSCFFPVRVIIGMMCTNWQTYPTYR